MDLDKLERLAGLRDSGAITDAEFEAEKSKLLQETDAYEPSYDDAERPRRAGRIIGAGAIVLLIGGAAAYLYANGFDPNPVIGPTAAVSSGSGWQFSTSTDPMNDEEVVTASRRIDAGEYVVDAQATCTGRTTLQYEFDIFRKDDSRDEIALQQGFGLNGMPTLRRTYEVRLDSGSSGIASVNSRHSNSILTRAGDSVQPSLFGPSPSDPQRMAAARKITIKVPMLHNDLTFEVPQTDNRIRDFLDSCHKAEVNTRPSASEADEASSGDVAATEAPTSEDQGAEPPSSNSPEPTGPRNEDGSFDLFANRG